jgi:SAM-dependent methyltransferase
VRAYPAVSLRRALAKGKAPWVEWLPERVRYHLDLLGGQIDPLKVELGSGPYPTPGYVHVDIDRSSRHLEYVAPVWSLPFDTGSVDELLAIHVLEHVHPAQVHKTLVEWRRVLRPGGAARIHVPNAPEIFHAFQAASGGRKWALVNALLGMYGGPDINNAEEIPVACRSDHQAVYDLPLLESVLLSAGFKEVRNLTGRIRDRHADAWQQIVPAYSLVVQAITPDPAT